MSAPQERVGEIVCLDNAEVSGDAVLPRIFGGDCDGDRIVVARKHRRVQRLGRGNGEDAGPGPDIEHSLRLARLQQAVERDEAALGARVVRRPEGKARIDLDACSAGARCDAGRALPCTTKRPARTGLRKASASATQFRSGMGSTARASSSAPPAAGSRSTSISAEPVEAPLHNRPTPRQIRRHDRRASPRSPPESRQLRDGRRQASASSAGTSMVRRDK